MISELLNALKKIKPNFLLIIFITLCLALQLQNGFLLKKPISSYALAIPILVLISHILVWWWTIIVKWLCQLLPKEDLINVGKLVACSILTFALLITFSFLGSQDRETGMSIISQPGFTYTLTLYILTFVTFEISD